MIKVYLAGKISKNGWRGQLFENLHNDDDGSDRNNLSANGYFAYAGPYFIPGEHGCNYHGANTHGRGADGDSEKWWVPSSTKEIVVEKCLAWIDKSDVMFAYIDSVDAYGTLTEIGYAMGKQIPIFVAISDEIDDEFVKDAWFFRYMATVNCFTSSIDVAWNEFTAWVKHYGSTRSGKFTIDENGIKPTGTQLSAALSLYEDTFKKEMILPLPTKDAVRKVIETVLEEIK